MTMHHDRLRELGTNCTTSISKMRLKVADTASKVEAHKEDASLFADARGEKIRETRDVAIKAMAPNLKLIQDAANVARFEQQFYRSKEFLLSKEGFSGGHTERLVWQNELKTLPASMVQLLLEDAVSTKNLALIYQIVRTGYERGTEQGWRETVNVADAMAKVVVPGQKQALAACASILADVREAEMTIGEVGGRNVSSDKINLGRMRAEAAELADAAAAEAQS